MNIWQELSAVRRERDEANRNHLHEEKARCNKRLEELYKTDEYKAAMRYFEQYYF